MERRRLFSDKPVERRKLFSTTDTPEERNIKLFSDTAEEEAFQRVFSATTDETELKLKEYSGQTLHAPDFASIFGANLDERYYTTNSETGDITISPSAFVESRLFSKLTISVTKTLELDPAVMNEPKESVIDRLEDSGKFSPKTIILLKKAHGISADNDRESYLKDSGITSDLPLEFGGRKMGKPEFDSIIKERYEDAPTDIMDILKNKGIIRVDGENVEIIK